MSNGTAIEGWVIDACQQLGLPVHTSDDDFFDAGATSLTVIRLIERVGKKFGEDALSPEDVIEFSSVRAIAETISTNIQAAKSVGPS
jgi:acyl carrier protein